MRNWSEEIDDQIKELLIDAQAYHAKPTPYSGGKIMGALTALYKLLGQTPPASVEAFYGDHQIIQCLKGYPIGAYIVQNLSDGHWRVCRFVSRNSDGTEYIPIGFSREKFMEAVQAALPMASDFEAGEDILPERHISYVWTISFKLNTFDIPLTESATA